MTAFAVFLLSFFAGIWHKPVSAVGCRSPPCQSGFFKKFRLEETGMSFNYGREEKNGDSGKKPRKSSYGAWVSMRIPSNNSIPTIGRSLIPTGGITADCRIQGYSTHEIASRLNSTEKAVYRRMDRLKEKLKKFFE